MIKKMINKNILTRCAVLAAAAAFAVPVSAATVAYWEFDNGDLGDAAVGNPSVYDLTNGGTAFTGSVTNLVSTIPNPEVTPGSVNAGSIAYPGDASSYFQGGVGSTAEVLLSNNSWTLEGWLTVGPYAGGPDVLLNTRGDDFGNGILVSRTGAGLGVYGAHGATNRSATFSNLDINNLVGETIHFALIWEATSAFAGDFKFYKDGTLTDTATLDFGSVSLASVDNGNGGSVPPTDSRLQLLGRGADTNGAFTAAADEFRLSDTALAPSQFLNVPDIPEPSTLIMAGLGLTGLCLRRRRA